MRTTPRDPKERCRCKRILRFGMLLNCELSSRREEGDDNRGSGADTSRSPSVPISWVFVGLWLAEMIPIRCCMKFEPRTKKDNRSGMVLGLFRASRRTRLHPFSRSYSSWVGTGPLRLRITTEMVQRVLAGHSPNQHHCHKESLQAPCT